MDLGASILDQAGEKASGNSKQKPQNTFNEITAESPQSRPSCHPRSGDIQNSQHDQERTSPCEEFKPKKEYSKP